MMSGVFHVVAEGIHRVAFPDTGIEFTVDRLRRERHELHCELSVACGIVGAKVIDEAILSRHAAEPVESNGRPAARPPAGAARAN